MTCWGAKIPGVPRGVGLTLYYIAGVPRGVGLTIKSGKSQLGAKIAGVPREVGLTLKYS